MPINLRLRRVKIFFRITAAIIVLLCFAVHAHSQSTTNNGTEFWTAYMDHNRGASNNGGLDSASLMSLYITSPFNTSGTVSIADNSFEDIPFKVSASQVTIVSIPSAAYLGSNDIAKKGIHVVTLKPVAIYAHIYASSVSGATLLLPVTTLGNDYFSINYNQYSNAGLKEPAYSDFAIVATEDNTTVQITPSNTLIDGHGGDATFTVALNKGQVYQGLSASDLTGTRIRSINSSTGACAKIAVFSGSSKIAIGCNEDYNTSDNLFQQVYPTASWGKNYITAPLRGRNYDVFRILLSDPATTGNPNVKLNDSIIPLKSFKQGYYEFPSQRPNVITADQPIQVVQYAVSQRNTITCGTDSKDIGDPEMIFLNPLEQTVNRVTLYSTGNFEILNSYINVIIKTSAVATFMLDGRPYTNFTTVPNNPLYSYAQIPVQSGPQDVQVTSGSRGTHNLSAADGFNAIAYGFGQHESYGYAAGTNLLNLNENIALANPGNSVATQTNGCLGVAYKLVLTLPYKTPNIVWDLKDGTTYTDNNPRVVSTSTKGAQTLYHYQYNKTISYDKAGDTSIIATVFNPVAGECGNSEKVEFDFNISSLPVAGFTAAGICSGDSTSFADNTNANGSFIKTWQWDFGDNTKSVQQNPKHLYAGPGTYNVTLTATNVNGCSTGFSQNVHILRNPAAAFVPSAPACAGQNITFTDQSVPGDGKIVQWLWSYGDGSADTFTDNRPGTHIYPNTGIDTVKLTVTTDAGCSNTFMQIITINPVPVVDFSLPDVCLNDTYAQFNDKSTIPDNSAGPFTYLWSFGDPNATEANTNTSTQQNPRHKYSQAGNYNVTLTVTSKYGCSFSKTKPFTVNGDTPVAAFSVENINNLCSMDDVIFDDQSTVNFGSITKIVWYFDCNNHPADTVMFLKGGMLADRKFHHNYGLFNSPLTKSYTVRMDVYSGITCVSTTQQNITIYANPQVTLSQLGAMCQNAQPGQIIENKNGFTGAGTFSGPGVSAGGLFDPSVSGAGAFTINYTFTAQNGCSYSTSQQVTVSPVPTVSAGTDIVLLQGSETTLPATASGDNLTYQWIPSTGLDHDNILNPTASPIDDITYKLIVTNAEGCSAAAQVNVAVLKNPVVPNAFTPNGDGINDTWNIKYLDTYPNNTVDVFNRYGAKVYSSVGYPVPWDGTYKGSGLPPGTYYYIINPKSGRKAISGSVTIIR